MKHKHLLQTFELLSTIYPEIKKVKKLASVIMKSVPQDYVPTEIKIPVVSTLGIKAIIKIGDIDYTPLS